MSTDNPLRLIKKVAPVTVSPLSDARLNDLMSGIGSTFDLINLADADTHEICVRQEQCRLLIENNELLDDNFFNLRDSGGQTLPNRSANFLTYQKKLIQKNTDFWARADAFLKIVKSFPLLPPRIARLLHVIQDEGPAKYQDEVSLAESILRDLRKVTAINGIVEFKKIKDGFIIDKKLESKRKLSRWSGHPKDISCYGTWPYHKALDPDDPEVDKPTLAMRVFEALGASTLESMLKKRRDRKRLKVAQIRHTPPAIAVDILEHLKGMFTVNSGTRQLSMIIRVAYTFDGSGLQIRLLDWENLSESHDTENKCFDFGDPETTIQKYERRFSSKYNHFVAARNHKENSAKINDWFIKHNTFIPINSFHTHKEFLSGRMHDVLERYRDDIALIKLWQRNINEAFDDLASLHAIVRTIKKSGLPYCFPEVAASEAIFGVSGCYPIRMGKQAAKPICPFQDISVNGQIVNLTGRNGSGKSTFMLALLDTQLMAQCGLPVYALSAVIAPRSHIFMSFLDRSSKQSTFKAKLEKDIAIIKGVRELTINERHKALVIVDELGSATDQVDVLRVAEPLVSWLSQQGVSMVMSTQIYELSQYVGEKCDGINIIINPDYSITEGIGTGEPFEVAKEMGLFDLLAEDSEIMTASAV